MSQVTAPQPECPQGHTMPAWTPRNALVLNTITDCALCTIESWEKLWGKQKEEQE